jgi:diguanylate cyclase (GGDEF)-like protein
MDWSRRVSEDEGRNGRAEPDVDLVGGLPEVAGRGLKVVVSRTLGGIPGILLILLVLLIPLGLLHGALSPGPGVLGWLLFPVFLITLSVAANRPLNSRFRFSSRQQLILGVVLSTSAILLLPMLSADKPALFLAGVWLILIWTYTLPTMIPGTPLAVTWGIALLSLAVGWWVQQLHEASYLLALLLILSSHLIGMMNVAHRDQTTARVLSVIRSVYRRAATDEVTGVFNRFRFAELAKREISRANRCTRPVTLLLIYIDCFKDINDRYGPEEGARALRTLADCVTRTVRDRGIVGRYSSDEFAVLLSGFTPPAAGEIARRILACTRVRTKSQGAVSFSLGISIGIAGTIDPRSTKEVSLEELIQSAGEVLNRPESDGRNGVRRSDICSCSISSRKKP